MVIQASIVNMNSERSYSALSHTESVSLETTAGQAVVLEVSEESKSLMEQMKEQQKKLVQQQQDREKKNMQDWLTGKTEKSNAAEGTAEDRIKSKEEMKLEMLKRILDALKRYRFGDSSVIQEMKQIQNKSRQMSSESKCTIGVSSGNAAASPAASMATGTLWTRTTVLSGFYMEQEHTAFSATGIAKTADGRELNFNVSFEMSRAFCEKYEMFTQEDFVLLTDPLVINLDTDIGSVSDQKFLFDIDSDGYEESISFAGQGSGFLALDQNGDGKINDGGELFGTKSGDGFADLAVYDEDGNGWIDEADSIFKDLRIWMKDEDGNDHLLNLKETGVGAIYLSSTGTQFHLKDAENNQTNGVIRKSGIYLKENGGVGTIQHIDLAI